MHGDLFYSFGRLIYKYKWLTIFVWLAIFVACIPFAPKLFEPFNAIGFSDPNSPSAIANTTLHDKLGFSYNQFIVMYHSDNLLATDPKFIKAIKDSLEDVKNIPDKHQIIYPDVTNHQISEDKHTAYAAILFENNQEADPKLLSEFKAAVKKPTLLNMKIGGEPIFLDDTKTQTQLDLYKAEYVATPVALITMLLVFGSVVAAIIPILLGGICALIILMALFGLGHVFSLSVFTLNIALLLGLCLSLDYALLIINRYRDELLHKRSPEDAVAITVATAGKAVFFSGLVVIVSLSALLLFPINVLFSVGIGGLAAVAVAVAIAVIFLPAILAVLYKRINLLTIIKQRKLHETYHWHWLITKAVKRPWLYFITTLIFLLILGFPFLRAEFGISDFKILPKTMESRSVFDTFQTEFGENKLSPIMVLIKTPKDNILTKDNIDALYKFSDQISKDPEVDKISGIVNTEPRLSSKEYQMLYTHPENLNPGLKSLLKNTTNGNLTVFTILSKDSSHSPKTTDFIKTLRQSQPGNNMTIEVTGGAANTMDILDSISETFPYALLWIICFTYVILLFFLRSIILPLKAIFTTILSLFASYGILTLVFQEGYLAGLLHFDPQGMLDISLLIIIFCALFGISMDYEVFLLTRIKEYYEQSHVNIKSVVHGIDRSSKIITSAAIIVMFICFAFMSADILIVKAFGLGIAVAVFVDAFIIRTIFVPALMTLLDKWNWYLPKWLDKILPRIAFDPEHYIKK